MRRLKELVYRPDTLRLLRRLRLTGLLRRWNYRLRVRDGVAVLPVMQTRARFVCRTPQELAHLEWCAFGLEGQFLDVLGSFLRPGMCFWDVGAYFGLFAIPAALKVGPQGTVVAFEPHPERYEQLLANAALNGLANVRAFRCALGEQNTTARLGGGGDPRIVSGESEHDGLEISTANGDDLLQRERLPVPDAIKIDVEGYEHSVLCGLQTTLARPEVRLVLCEVHPGLLPVSTNPEQIAALLRSLGFSRIEPWPRLYEIQLIASKPQQA